MSLLSLFGMSTILFFRRYILSILWPFWENSVIFQNCGLCDFITLKDPCFTYCECMAFKAFEKNICIWWKLEIHYLTHALKRNCTEEKWNWRFTWNMKINVMIMGYYCAVIFHATKLSVWFPSWQCDYTVHKFLK